jgi:radical SAM protein with 4Fe4S-binding SPASM domain
LDGASPATYEHIRRGARFEKVLANLRSFNRLKSVSGKETPRLRLNHVLSESNIHEFEDFLELAESLGVQCIDVRTVTPFRNAAYGGTAEDAFFARVRECKESLARWIERTGVEDAGYLRERYAQIDLMDAAGEKICCRQPWESMAIPANGDALPCITWTKPPLGNLWLQSFEEIWQGEGLKRLRLEFERRRPGPDCQYCTVRKDEPPEVDDDCFYRMLAKKLPGELAALS